MDKCIDHLDFTDQTCPDCSLEVDAYGNTEDQFDYCAFPDCGCDGSRLCMAGEASDFAQRANVEGMWTGKTNEQRSAVLDLYGEVLKEAAQTTLMGGVTMKVTINISNPRNHEAADAFWKYWEENGETHKHGYYESTWGAINAALAVAGVSFRPDEPVRPSEASSGEQPDG